MAKPKQIAWRILKLSKGSFVTPAANYYGCQSVCDLKAMIKNFTGEKDLISVTSAKMHFKVNAASLTDYQTVTPFLAIYQDGGTFTGQYTGTESPIQTLIDAAIDVPCAIQLGRTVHVTKDTMVQGTWDITPVTRDLAKRIEPVAQVDEPEVCLGLYVTQDASKTVSFTVAVEVNYTISLRKPQNLLKG